MITISNGLFTLHTAHTTYQMIVDADGRLCHSWYGSKTEENLWDSRPTHAFDPGCWPDQLPLECAGPGLGDNRLPSVLPEYADGSRAADFRFVRAEVRPDKYALPGLPAFRQGPGVETLAVTLRDAAGLEAELLYGVYEDCDLITRAVIYTNRGEKPLKLHQAGSLCLDFDQQRLDLITFDGVWAGEHIAQRRPIYSGVQSVGSTRGIPGHAHNPAAILCRPDTGETCGDCWGFALVYSGSFLIQAERGAGRGAAPEVPLDGEAGIRLTMGIHPQHFCWTLEPGQSFAAPEVAMAFSDRGLGELSRRFHNAIRRHLLPPRWSNPETPRPVLLNSWEACYFDFDENKLLELAQAAKEAEIDLFVLDDGWFRNRDSTEAGLGDWTADTRKLPEGLPGLCKKLNALGLDFGLWVEPEAVSPDSDLYRAHPDWALEIPGRETLEIRHQYNLDLSREDVREGIWQQLRALLDSCPIRYLKWDMNRSLANVYSAALPPECQGEVYHRYVLGLYDLQQRLTQTYPDLLLENCASGGGRYDCGMLYYSPQIWCSDNTDARARLGIQHGTSYLYPACTMGAHFSTIPNHNTGRTASVEARMALALSGTFGFELDLTRYSPEERKELAVYVRWYRAHGALVRGGDLYRLIAPEEADSGGAWMFVSPDRTEAAVFAVGTALGGGLRPRLPLQGLEEHAVYADEEGAQYTGGQLLRQGLPLPGAWGEAPGRIWYLKQIERE
ncbi:MAG: alpha-galactosidase [Clostridiales bacterium]|nr:alpha-galactosidase [Clostridiales bacterium]